VVLPIDGLGVGAWGFRGRLIGGVADQLIGSWCTLGGSMIDRDGLLLLSLLVDLPIYPLVLSMAVC
jgi:hypothetical protein